MPWLFALYMSKARRLLAGGRLPVLLAAAFRKSRRQGSSGLKEDVGLLLALCRAWWRGEYRQVDRKAFVAIVAALIYFVSPVDLIPDWLLGVGLVDDLAVLGWVMRTWGKELAAFRNWRDRQPASRLAALEAPLEEERRR